jgi:4-coumarate--CoA ligase
MDNSYPGSCGTIIMNTEAKIVDAETGESLGTGMRGELVVRGPQVRNYVNCCY